MLDHNLARLLRRAYVPVLPRTAFRERLALDWTAGVRELAQRRERERAAIVAWTDPLNPRRSYRVRPGFVLAAAAVLAFVLLVPALLDAFLPRPATPGTLLASGSVALRALDGGDWSTLAVGTDGWQLSEPGLELYTPEGRTLRVLAPDGSLEIGAGTHASIAASASGLAVRLDGELAAERRADAARDWSFADERVPERVNVRLDAGRLELALRRGSGEALLVHGAASQELAGGAARALVPGERVSLQPPPPPSAALAGEPVAAGERQPVDGAEGAEAPSPDEAEPDLPGPPAFAGDVRDEHDAPLTSFTVAFLPERVGNDYQEPTVRDFAAADGAFRCSPRRAGTYHVFVHAPGYAQAALGPNAFDGEHDAPLGTVRLARGGSVRGFLVDAGTGNPLPGALVLSERDAPSFGLPLAIDPVPDWLTAWTRTRSDGSFELEHLSPGEHVVRISTEGHAPLWIPGVALAEGARVELGTRSLGHGGRLEGTVRRPDGALFAGAHLVVTMMDTSSASPMSFALTQTDPDGRYAVEDLPAGQLLAVFLGDFSAPPAVRPIRIQPGVTTTLDFPEDKPAGTRLFGRLLRADGTPLALRNLSLVDSSARSQEDEWVATTSDAQGNYTFEAVQPGNYSLLEVDSFGRWLALIATFDVPAWPEFQLDARRLDTALEGRAVTESDEPVSSILILERVDGSRRTFAGFVRTAGDGSFALHGLPEGRYELTSYAMEGALGHEPAEPFVLDAAAPRQEFLFRHAPGTMVDVSVTDEDGRPLAGAMIEFLDERGRTFSFEQSPLTDELGRHTASGVRPGRYRVCATLAGYDQGCVELECRVGTRAALQIGLSSEGK